ncbi:MAG: elongator complex protein 3 [Acutalibacteraceae bacterium]
MIERKKGVGAPKRCANVALFVPHAGCPHNCCFCDQHTIAGQTRLPSAAEVTAACNRALETLPADRTAQIAFFGGSFTAIDRGDMLSLLCAAQPFLQTGRFDGIRVSTRPDAVDDEILSVLAAYGVKAVELGAQSMDDRVLAACGRGHTSEDTRRAAERIHAHGLSLGLQMMTGLPGDTDEGARRTAKALAALSPDTVRVYPTVVLRGTPLAKLWEAGRYRAATLEQSVALCAQLLVFFERECGIPVIRMGLHDGQSLKAEVLAGAYHPAFRELCEGQVYVSTALSVLTRAYPHAADDAPVSVWLAVHPRAVSKMIGQNRRNLFTLRSHGFSARVKADETLGLWDVKLITGREET